MLPLAPSSKHKDSKRSQKCKGVQNVIVNIILLLTLSVRRSRRTRQASMGVISGSLLGIRCPFVSSLPPVYTHCTTLSVNLGRILLPKYHGAGRIDVGESPVCAVITEVSQISRFREHMRPSSHSVLTAGLVQTVPSVAEARCPAWTQGRIRAVRHRTQRLEHHGAAYLKRCCSLDREL